jgi:hypothetical protein
LRPVRASRTLPLTPVAAAGLLALLAAAPASALPAAEDPPDLVVVGRRVELGGEQSFGTVFVGEGGELAVAPYAGVIGGGRLLLRARRIEVAAGGRIQADAAGWRGRIAATGEGPGGGQGGPADFARGRAAPLHPTGSGAGGAYGGRGGDGIHEELRGAWKGGRPYGEAAGEAVELGSAGGGPIRSHHEPIDYPGGNGGGVIELRAEELVLAGSVSARGAEGPSGSFDSGGGGSGGGILLVTSRLEVTGSVTVRGGAGGVSQDVGGSGGGGRIKVFYRRGLPDPARFDVRPGRGPCPAPDAASPAGCEGSLHLERLPTPSTLYLPRLERWACARSPERAVLFLLDASESMAAPAPGGSTWLAQLVGTLRSAVGAIGAREPAGVVAFHDVAWRPLALSLDRAALDAALAGIGPAPGSRVDAGLELALATLAEAPAGDSRLLVLVSDGRWEPDAAARAVALASGRPAAVDLRAVAVGRLADAPMLARLTGSPARVWQVSDPAALTAALRAALAPEPCAAPDDVQAASTMPGARP